MTRSIYMTSPSNACVIGRVRDEFGWMSNMSAHPIRLNGMDAPVTWPTAEHLFQATRFLNEEIRELIRVERSPMSAKMVAKVHAQFMTRNPRSEEDLDMLRVVLRYKLSQHCDLQRKLLATGTRHIVEDCSRRATESGLFWGACRDPDGTWRGQNMLGCAWMELRKELRPTISVDVPPQTADQRERRELGPITVSVVRTQLVPGVVVEGIVDVD